MQRYEAMRDDLRSGKQKFKFLDAAQLVKHAFGIVTDAERKGKNGVLIYLFAEPPFLNGEPIAPDVLEKHRTEITKFAEFVSDSAVGFHALSYREWISTWGEQPDGLKEHAQAILAKFSP